MKLHSIQETWDSLQYHAEFIIIPDFSVKDSESPSGNTGGTVIAYFVESAMTAIKNVILILL